MNKFLLRSKQSPRNYTELYLSKGKEKKIYKQDDSQKSPVTSPNRERTGLHMVVVSYTSVPGTQIMPSASCYKCFSVLPEDTLWSVGLQLDRLVMIYGIWWRNMLSSLLTPQGGNNPELCYVLSPGVSSMADPWSSLMANTTDPNPLFPHCSYSHDSQGTSGCHFFHTLFNFYPVFFFECHNCAAWFLPNLIQARVI